MCFKGVIINCMDLHEFQTNSSFESGRYRNLILDNIICTVIYD